MQVEHTGSISKLYIGCQTHSNTGDQMNHNTQINKRSIPDLETILNVGRTATGDIYVDIRVYHYGDIIEVGDVTLTQSEWNTINDNLDRGDVELFICPECGDIVTEEDILESLTSGGFGMCMCKFGDGQRTLVRYDPYTPDVDITANEARLIKVIRSLSG